MAALGKQYHAGKCAASVASNLSRNILQLASCATTARTVSVVLRFVYRDDFTDAFCHSNGRILCCGRAAVVLQLLPEPASQAQVPQMQRLAGGPILSRWRQVLSQNVFPMQVLQGVVGQWPLCAHRRSPSVRKVCRNESLKKKNERAHVIGWWAQCAKVASKCGLFQELFQKFMDYSRNYSRLFQELSRLFKELSRLLLALLFHCLSTIAQIFCLLCVSVVWRQIDQNRFAVVVVVAFAAAVVGVVACFRWRHQHGVFQQHRALLRANAQLGQRLQQRRATHSATDARSPGTYFCQTLPRFYTGRRRGVFQIEVQRRDVEPEARQ